jgi:hypothetical protein
MTYLIGQFTPNQEKWVKHYHKLIGNALSKTNVLLIILFL